MKLKVLKDFIDGEDKKTIYKEGSVIEVSNARGKEMLSSVLKVVEVQEEKKPAKKE